MECSKSNIWLVVWNIFFHSVGKVIIPTDELIFFGGLGQAPFLIGVYPGKPSISMGHGLTMDMLVITRW